MEHIQYKKNEILHKKGDPVETLDLILQGRVIIREGSTYTIKAKEGVVLGIFESVKSVYSYDYIAASDCLVLRHPYTGEKDVSDFIRNQFSDRELLITGAAGLVISLSSRFRYMERYTRYFYNTLKNTYLQYRKLCATYHLGIQTFPFFEAFQEFSSEQELPLWINDYYDQLEILPDKIKREYYGAHPVLLIGTIMEATKYASDLFSLCNEIYTYENDLIQGYFTSNQGDLFDLYLQLQKAATKSPDFQRILKAIEITMTDFMDAMHENPLVPQEICDRRYGEFLKRSVPSSEENAKEIQQAMVEEEKDAVYAPILNSLDIILKYANMDEGENERFCNSLKEFRLTQDKNSSSEKIRNLRSDITNSFFHIYEAALLNSLDSTNIPTILKMFFNFGYIDEELIGKDNALLLYEMAQSLEDTIEGEGESHIYTIYGWLKSIYRGENEPSINEFDQDYATYISSQRAGGFITAEMEQRYLQSPREKLRFEIDNFFKEGMKIASGRPTAFCPLLSSHTAIKPLDRIFVKPKDILSNWNNLKAVDYSCFYREILFQSKEYHIAREPIMVEVMPNVILMPCIGNRGALWQETGGIRRDTPARMFVPIFSNEDLSLLQYKLAAEFRWEICKKINGARWNDVVSHSLTSDYFDYLQFYKKNSELSQDARDRIRSSLINAKNSFKNVFISDYLVWVKYESQGAMRLNKVARNIMFSYCPFSKTYRQKLLNHPVFGEMVRMRDNQTTQKLRTLGSHYSKIQKNNGDIPPEIRKYLDYLGM